MLDKVNLQMAEKHEPGLSAQQSRGRSILRSLGWLGVMVATPFFLWVPLALITPLPSMIDVFGIVGLRIPASITIGALLLAAIGFHEF